MAQRYLHEKGYARVMVFHMLNEPRNNVGNFPVSGGYSSDETRDRAMTLVSHRDIAWVRPGKEQSGTCNDERQWKDPIVPNLGTNIALRSC